MRKKTPVAVDAPIQGEVVAATAAAPGRVEAFAFGDPEPVLGGRGFMDYVACWQNGKWFDPPVSLGGLSRSFRASPHHSSAILIKRNLLVSTLEPTPLLDRKTFEGMALDYLVMANAYAERRDNFAGRPVRLVRSPARYTRRGTAEGMFYFLQSETALLGQDFEFKAGSVYQMMEPDLDQELYGIPGYMSALQAAFLNEAATIFRRRYYLNGSHAGFILYMNGAGVDKEDVDSIRQALRDSKGPGNFRNLFLHAPGGDKDAIKLIPVSEVAAKDEFLGIKNTTRDDVLAAHRVPPQLLGIIPSNAAGFGSPEDAAAVFFRNEIVPLQNVFLELNDWLGVEAVRFRPYQPAPHRSAVLAGATSDLATLAAGRRGSLPLRSTFRPLPHPAGAAFLMATRTAAGPVARCLRTAERSPLNGGVPAGLRARGYGWRPLRAHRWPRASPSAGGGGAPRGAGGSPLEGRGPHSPPSPALSKSGDFYAPGSRWNSLRRKARRRSSGGPSATQIHAPGGMACPAHPRIA